MEHTENTEKEKILDERLDKIFEERKINKPETAYFGR